VWNHAKEHRRINILVVIEGISAMRNQRWFEEMISTCRHYRITFVLIGNQPQDVGHLTLINADVLVLGSGLSERSYRRMFEDVFSCYVRLQLFKDAHARVSARDSNLVWVNAGAYDDVYHSIFSLALPFDDQKSYVLEPLYHARSISDMEEAELAEVVGALLSGKDAFVSERQALQLFRTGTHSPDDFANSRYASAIYAAWIAHVHTELLAIRNTSCGHVPQVLCHLVIAFLRSQPK
jgi:hypothetical protein